jgi:hypothetical protein
MSATARSDALAEALVTLQERGRSLVLSTDPQYPDQLIFVDPEEDSSDGISLDRELLARAFDEQAISDPGWNLLAKTSLRAGRAAVYQ